MKNMNVDEQEYDPQEMNSVMGGVLEASNEVLVISEGHELDSAQLKSFDQIADLVLDNLAQARENLKASLGA